MSCLPTGEEKNRKKGADQKPTKKSRNEWTETESKRKTKKKIHSSNQKKRIHCLSTNIIFIRAYCHSLIRFRSGRTFIFDETFHLRVFLSHSLYELSPFCQNAEFAIFMFFFLSLHLLLRIWLLALWRSLCLLRCDTFPL